MKRVFAERVGCKGLHHHEKGSGVLPTVGHLFSVKGDNWSVEVIPLRKNWNPQKAGIYALPRLILNT